LVKTPPSIFGLLLAVGIGEALRQQQINQALTHDFGAVEHGGDFDVFVGLVGEFKDAGAVGDAVFQAADAINVFLIVGARRDHIFGGFAKDGLDCSGDRGDDGGIFGCHRGDNALDFADGIGEIFAVGFYFLRSGSGGR
jgi:hypothetical protein